MSDPFLLDYDPFTQTQTIIHTEERGNHDFDWTIESLQNADDLIEQNKMFYNSTDERARFGEHFVRVASLPMNLAMKLHAEGRLDDKKSFDKWLNDPDNKYFRTRPGRL